MNLKATIEVLKHIPKTGAISTLQLKEHLEQVGIDRNIRSIQRLMNSLCECLPIEQDRRDQLYGYRWTKDAQIELSIPGLNRLEALLLLLARDHLATIMPPSLMKDMQYFFTEAQNQLSSGHGIPEREWRRKVAISQRSHPLQAPNMAEGVFETVADCLFSNKEVEVLYRNRHGEDRIHQLRPLGLVDSYPVLYLIAEFVKRPGKPGTLVLHRISRAQKTDFQFEPLQDFDLHQFIQEGQLTYGDGSKVRLSFEIGLGAGLHLTEAPLSEDQEVEELEDRYRITATVFSSMQLHNFLYGISQDVIGEISIEDCE